MQKKKKIQIWTRSNKKHVYTFIGFIRVLGQVDKRVSRKWRQNKKCILQLMRSQSEIMRERKREGERERQYRLKPRQKSSRFYSLDLILHFFIVNRPRFVAHLHINASVSLSQISETWNIFENYFRPGGSEECYERGEKFRSFSFPRYLREFFANSETEIFTKSLYTSFPSFFFFRIFNKKRFVLLRNWVEYLMFTKS